MVADRPTFFNSKLPITARLKHAVKLRLREFLGIIVIASSLLLILASFVYSPNHIIALKTSNLLTENFLSVMVQLLSEVGLKYLGLNYFLIAIVIMIWGYRLLFHYSIKRYWLRVIAFLMMILSGCFALAILNNSLGGAIGVIEKRLFLPAAPMQSFKLFGVFFGLLMVAGLCFFYSLAISYQEWRVAIKKLEDFLRVRYQNWHRRAPVRVKKSAPKQPSFFSRYSPLASHESVKSKSNEEIAIPPATDPAAEGWSEVTMPANQQPAESSEFSTASDQFSASMSESITGTTEQSVATMNDPNHSHNGEENRSRPWWHLAGQNRPKPLTAWWRASQTKTLETDSSSAALPMESHQVDEAAATADSVELEKLPFAAPLIEPPPEPIDESDSPPSPPRQPFFLVNPIVPFDLPSPVANPVETAVEMGSAHTELSAPLETATGFTPDPAISETGAAQTSNTESDPEEAPFEYQLPPTSLLTAPESEGYTVPDAAELYDRERELEGVLADFGIKGEIVKARPGPVVTLFELDPAPGTKSSRVISLAEDIARSMSAHAVRIALIPGRSVIGIELPNPHRELVYFREIVESSTYQDSSHRVALILGKDISGAPIVVDLAPMPHLLIAGTTGSGKSVGINAMILSILYRMTPKECRMIMIDPKMLELSVYDGIPHLLSPVVTDPKKAIVALKWAVREMENRYRLMSRLGVRNIAAYNLRMSELEQASRNNPGTKPTNRVQVGFDAKTGVPLMEEREMDLTHLPNIVVIVDEMADLMLVAGKEIEGAIQRLAQMARAAGIHLITATQRPSVDVITGTIKANFPTRISFMVTSKIDSRTILGESGAEQLLGQGDMLYMAGGNRISRVHGPFVTDREVERVVDFLKSQAEPVYVNAITDDPSEAPGLFGDMEDESPADELYDKAVAIVARERRATTSYIQRILQIGYNRAARLIERMEAEGIVGPPNHVGKREVLLPISDNQHDSGFDSY